MAKPKRWYSMQASTQNGKSVAEIRIYDEIGFWGTTAKEFVSELDEVSKGAESILVSINSPGGDVFDAFAIYNALKRNALPVETRVDGVAASAASLILMAGDNVVMPENAMIMIHNVWTFAAGEAEDLRKTADLMDKLRDGIVAAYVAKTGKDSEEIIQMMDETTWMTALEAHAMGFCDALEEPVKLAASATVVGMLAKFKDAPRAFIDSLDEADASKAPEADPAPADPPAADDTPAEPTSEDPSTQPAEPLNVAAFSKVVFAACREKGIEHLAEPILTCEDFTDMASVSRRIQDCADIHAMCVTVKLQEKSVDFVRAGLTVEQVRARLFDTLTSQSADNISNLQRPQDERPQSAGPSVSAIYAARAAKHSKHRH
ncbi:head maturation protease, ClpP-related [Orrella marina]|uniref:ATP-dependent Clp protease proteolytic subunit n=1 Tax=Orrella marina TaxID=2163011 RepID=A0A2R4XEY6_9BURK|nr:head maturation protease, ClpP-related [Orrella marina]AWB32372.1 peptidase S14 [Orrella marina]